MPVRTRTVVSELAMAPEARSFSKPAAACYRVVFSWSFSFERGLAGEVGLLEVGLILLLAI